MVTDLNFNKNYTELQNLRFGKKSGSSLLEVLIVTHLPIIFNCSTVLLLYRFNIYFKTNFSIQIFLLEFFGCVFPLIIFLTLLSDYIYEFFTSFFLIFCFYLYLQLKLKRNRNIILEHSFVRESKLPCISVFRGGVNLYSVICILAADFTCFPERFLKTEFYGFSLMDTGVGLFIIAFSLSSTHFRIKQTNLSSTFITLFRKVLPLLLIGIGRYISTSSLNYLHHTFEYGIHWNFFFTLFFLALFNEFMFFFIRSVKNTFLFSIFILIIYEFILKIGLKDWIFSSAPRISFLSANREGISSLIGYEILYMWGILIKNYLPKKGDSLQKYIYTINLFARYFVVCVILTLIYHYFIGVSRRCVNCGYIFWITTISLSSLILLIIFELFLYILFDRNNPHVIVPKIIESINFNGFIFFILGNIITGIINLNICTLILNNISGVSIIILYCACCCSVTSFLFYKNYRIR